MRAPEHLLGGGGALSFVSIVVALFVLLDVVSLHVLMMWWGLGMVIRVALGKEQQENKRAIHNSQQKISEQSAVSSRNPILVHSTFLRSQLNEFEIFVVAGLKCIKTQVRLVFVCIQGPDVLTEPSDGGRRRQLKAATSA